MKAGGAGALALTLGSAGVPVGLFGEGEAKAAINDNLKLQFNSDGTFKIVQFNDTQDDEHIDLRNVELMEKVLDAEKPDLVVLNGDNITSGCDTAAEMKQAMNNVARPMEQRGIKWAVTFGNHDEDSTPNAGPGEEEMLQFYMAYKFRSCQHVSRQLLRRSARLCRKRGLRYIRIARSGSEPTARRSGIPTRRTRRACADSGKQKAGENKKTVVPIFRAVIAARQRSFSRRTAFLRSSP
ncbi:metallophosphoesterase [Paenibacillus sp. GYB003]|uniref:metallophosphoesterase n=1 Tax=Paenibacillus sp. GYB003 TaxID=2994392 RepID=UPI002F9633C3